MTKKRLLLAVAALEITLSGLSAYYAWKERQ